MSVSPIRLPGTEPANDLIQTLRSRLAAGDRFAALLGRGGSADGVVLTAVVAHENGMTPLVAALPTGRTHYPSLTPHVPAAFWYERMIHDLTGAIPDGHPRLDPLVLPHPDSPAAVLPCPGSAGRPQRIEPDERALRPLVYGSGIFTIPHGPVRSGVFESVEYLIETPGEDIPLLRVRPHAKHRGLQKRFEGLHVADGVLLAERVEGIASVAHALAFAHAVETLAQVRIPPAAELVRVLHAELERIANHLDVLLKLTDAAGLAVAATRFGLHKERTLRLVGTLCGSRFGRGVVIPGGVTTLPRLSSNAAIGQLEKLAGAIDVDVRILRETPSFLDRVRNAGPLDPGRARAHGALGPVGRASGVRDDCRVTRSYDGYPRLGPLPASARDSGDAQARMLVRIDEMEASFFLAEQALGHLADCPTSPLYVETPAAAGQALGWAEAPQGELLYLLELDIDGRITYCAPRSASFHNLALFPATFVGDILTDFPFIEASFGLSIAGTVM